ncbi:MAG: putative Spermidine N(1)-acetyltransferase [Promethearchaeota archaeon]|nr:MAG: putative Spermidine N(1)-acetyltransferase [Candidatus Lokiarchaeota archaeon]
MSKEDHYAFIQGDRIDLTPRNKEHIEIYTKWQNDPNVRRLMRNEIPKTVAEMEKRFESRGEENDRTGFELWHKGDKKPIGSAGIFRISWTSRTAIMGLKIAYIFTTNKGSYSVAEKAGFTRVGILKNEGYVNGKFVDAYIYKILREEWEEIVKS